jgi:hypothetical protein
MYGDEERRETTPPETNLGSKNVGRGSSVVEQRSEEPRVASSILALGTKKSPVSSEDFLYFSTHYLLIPKQKEPLGVFPLTTCNKQLCDYNVHLNGNPRGPKEDFSHNLLRESVDNSFERR